MWEKVWKSVGGGMEKCGGRYKKVCGGGYGKVRVEVWKSVLGVGV